MKNDEIAAILAGNNDNTNDNSTTTTTTTTRPEEATIMGTDTAPADEENELGLGKTDGEESERSDDEEKEDESEDELTDSAYNKVDDQKSYFNDGTEEVTNILTVIILY